MVKQRCIMLCLMIFTVGTLFSQARFVKTIHDFRTIKETDGKVSCVFEFTNVGKKPYVIDFVSVSCGCTTPDYNKAPVMPGKNGRIEVVYDPAGRPGLFNRSIVVTANNRRDQITLTIKGDVVGRPRSIEEDYPELLTAGLRASTRSLLFGYAARGGVYSQVFNVYNSGGEPLTIGAKIISGNGALCKIKVSPEVLQPKQKGQVIFTYNFSSADVWGLIATRFQMVANGKPSPVIFESYATVTENFGELTESQKAGAPRADFSSQFYHLGDVKQGEKLSWEFFVSNSGKDPLIFRSIKPNSNKIEYSIDKTTILPGETAVLKTTLKALDKGRINESITIIVNDPARPMREIRLAAIVN